MSIQSDVEMISIQAMEKYALRNQMTAKEVNQIFREHQVFEKIILQHEYLHQVSFEEIMEFVDKVIEESTDEFILFHGTIHDFNKIMLDKSHNRRDFLF